MRTIIHHSVLAGKHACRTRQFSICMTVGPWLPACSTWIAKSGGSDRGAPLPYALWAQGGARRESDLQFTCTPRTGRSETTLPGEKAPSLAFSGILPLAVARWQRPAFDIRAILVYHDAEHTIRFLARHRLDQATGP